MRVITGTARGRKLATLEGQEVRPTTDMVKEAMFSILQFEMEGANVLDLFAGSGQLGIEALSRGAASAVFVDMRREAARLVEENLRLTGLKENAKVVCGDALAYLSTLREKVDLVFLDPPYGSGLIKKSLQQIETFDILRENGIIICESDTAEPLEEMSPPYRFHRTYRYGRVRLTVYHRREGAEV